MITILIRAAVLYGYVLFSMRLMGKGELAEMQPFELVIMIMMAEAAALPMEDLGVPLLNGFIAISALLFLQIFISFINLKSERARGFICGKPSILVNKGKINQKELNKLRININDLIEQMRSKDYPALEDVEYVILETNGDLSVIPKENKRGVTIEDLDEKSNYEGLPITLIIDGKINHDNLIKANITEKWLLSRLKAKGSKSVEEILFCYIDEDKELFIQKKDK
ncbi:MAG: DUF421 domain-containing protein [Firmicutes bacterium]|nr:DUF421 domain-containing protein [Bacillota bacterium]